MTIKKFQIPVLGCITELLPLISKPYLNNASFDSDYAINNWFPPVTIGEIAEEVTLDEIFVWEAQNKLLGLRYSNNTNSYLIYEINPANNTCTLFKNLGELIPNKLCGVAYAAGILWFFGGTNKSTNFYSNTLYSYELATETLTNRGSSGLARISSCGCCIGDKVTFISGQLSNYAYANQTTTFTISTSAFVNVSTSLPAPRVGGRMIACNGKGYYLGAQAIDNWLNGGKFYEWDPTANTWTQVGYLDTDFLQGRHFPFVVSNEVYVATVNSNTSNTTTQIEVFKYVVGTGLVAVMGLGVTTPAFNTQDCILEYLKSACVFNDVIYFIAFNESLRGGKPSYDIYGTMSITNNSITPVLYQIGTDTLYLTTSREVITVAPDTLALMQIDKVDASGNTLASTTLLETLSSAVGENRYWNNLAIPIAGTFSVVYGDKMKIRYQGAKGEWSAWSDIYSGGGE